VGNEAVEKMVIPLANTGAKPDAMMVELEYTVVADMAVVASRWLEYVASGTELEFK